MCCCFKRRHVPNVDTPLNQRTGQTQSCVINILAALASMLHLVLTHSLTHTANTNTLSPRPTKDILPLCCSDSSAEGRLDTGGEAMLPITPFFRWPAGEMKNNPSILIPKTLNTLILPSQGALLFASSAAMATARKTIRRVCCESSAGAWSEKQRRHNRNTTPRQGSHLEYLFYREFTDRFSWRCCVRGKKLEVKSPQFDVQSDEGC